MGFELEEKLEPHEFQNLVELFRLLFTIRQNQKSDELFFFDLAQACNLQTPSQIKGETNENI
ncbi:MAG: hypothetical protein A4S09_02255 [Proteobacteria bacterium SG_bin7]|nr:MAG: hypothetical protein A4S09_02255 [Proteobacteria bacterium SG_bin7]